MERNMIDQRTSVQKLHHDSVRASEYDDYHTGGGGGVEKENDTSTANKISEKDDTCQPERPQGGYMWRLSSGLVSSTAGVLSGAVGLGVGGVKWVASKGYSAGGAVVGTTKNIVGKVPVPVLKKKDKKE